MNEKDLLRIKQAAQSIAMPDAEIGKLIARLIDMEEPKEEKAPALKKQLCILVSDPAGIIKTDLVGWVVQIPEEESPSLFLEQSVFRAAYDFNASKRGSLHPVQTVGEAMECVGSKHFKENGVWVKTKIPVLVVTTRNEIPKSGGLLTDDNRGDYTAVEIRTSKGSVRIDEHGIAGIDEMIAAEARA